jgi:monothiol glutaredoxin
VQDETRSGCRVDNLGRSRQARPMSIHEEIGRLVASGDVVLFMKGTREMPGCGFSATVVGILDQILDDYVAVNVLESPEMRDGIKTFSDWPTIPQLYIKGEFIGGCDIVTQLAESGDLETQIGDSSEPLEPPNVDISEAAAAAFLNAMEGETGLAVRLEVDANFRPNLTLGEATSRDVKIVIQGLTLVLDPRSARRAEGVAIDFEPGEHGGFRIDNPNEQAQVRQLGPQALKERLDAGASLELFDVRTDEERAIAKLEAARLLDDAADAHIQSLPKDTPLYFLCHHGMRSQDAAQRYLAKGFTKLYNVQGGIDAWSQLVDPAVPRY